MRVEPDNWLKSIFSHDVLRIVDFGQDSSEQQELESVLHSQDKAFFFTKIPVTCPYVLRKLLISGFQVVDINVTLERKPKSLAKSKGSGCIVRIAYPEECEAVMEIAETCFTRTRFHQDPKIPKNLANTIKRKWVENYFTGERGECILVAEVSGKPAGFLAIINMQTSNQTVRIIDLIGVHPEFQGRGIGTKMVDFFISDSVGRCDLLRVGTQIINLSSLHLYERAGFCISDSTYVLHAHVREGKVIQ